MNLPTFGGGAAQSTLNPIILVALLIAIGFILTLPKDYIIAPVLLSIFLIPMGQQVVVGGVHWLAPRIIILSGLFRILVLKVTSDRVLAGGFGVFDRLFFGYVFCEVLGFVIQYNFQVEAITQQLGIVIDFVGGYFLVRVLITNDKDMYRALKWMALATGLLAAGMMWEQLKLQNVFGVLGGTRAAPEIREGKIRSQAVFQHSIIAGTFAATLLPLFFLLWKNGRAKVSAVVGLASCSIMTICSNSSTPLLAYCAGMFAICLWPIRKSMRITRRALAVSLVLVHMVMAAPVWFLIARIDLTGGSSGYHRAELVDQFIRHFSEWWLVGTHDSINWGLDMWDQQNQYVSIGETGGLVALVLFIALICRQFAVLGKARKMVEGNKQEWLYWSLGAALFAHCVAFFGVNYFDQSKVSWFMLLAMISAVTTVSGPPITPSGDNSERESRVSRFSIPSHTGVDWSTFRQPEELEVQSMLGPDLSGD